MDVASREINPSAHAAPPGANGTEPRPVALPVLFDNIPAELRAIDGWLLWRYERVDGRYTKVPYSVHGGAGSSTDPTTWATFEQARAAYEAGGWDGVGLAHTFDHGLTGIDLDKCRAGQTGELRPSETAIVARLDTYAEASPSGTGVRAFAFATKPGRRCVLPSKRYEMYDGQTADGKPGGRFLTVTGHRLDGAPTTVNERQAVITELYGEWFPPKPPPSANGRHSYAPPPSLSDEEILDLLRRERGGKAARLLDGDTSMYGGDHSVADEALCWKIRFYGADAPQIDRIFRESGLYRPKWERQDYRDRTIENALDGVTEFYSPPRSAKLIFGTTGADNGHGLLVKPNEADDDPHRLARLCLWDHERDLFSPTRGVPPEYIFTRFWSEEFYAYNGRCYRPVPAKEMRARVTEHVKREFDRLNLEALEAYRRRKKEAGANNGAGEGKETKPPEARKVTQKIVADVMQALTSLTVLPSSLMPPAWIEPPYPFPASEVLPVSNGLLHLPGYVAGQSGSLLPHTNNFFALNALDYAFRPDAPEPAFWLAFLRQLWPQDQQSIDTLQEIFGYLLLPDTSQQKVFLFVGPKRSGKGTIARVLGALLGWANVVGPTLSSLATQFGLWPLIGKLVAIIADARLSGRSDTAVIVERLLSISGEDVQTIDRKNMAPITTKLFTRFLILTNELPRLSDNSGALVGRMVLLRLMNSWYGQEDTRLTGRLLSELPSILLWAIRGWDRLNRRGHFLQPEHSRDLLQEMEDLASPINEFVREYCEVGPGYRVLVRDLFDLWKEFCKEKGRDNPGTEQVFGRDLHAAVPSIEVTRPRQGESRVRCYEGIKVKNSQDSARF